MVHFTGYYIEKYVPEFYLLIVSLKLDTGAIINETVKML